MTLAGSVSHTFRILSVPVHGIGRTIPFLGGAKWTRNVFMFIAVAVLSALRLTHASSAFEEHEDLRLEARHGVELDGELRHRGAMSVDGSRKAERSALRECWRKRSDA